MLRLRLLLLLVPDRHLIKEGRQPVHVPQEVRVQSLLTGQRDDPALSAACDRAGPSEPRGRMNSVIRPTSNVSIPTSRRATCSGTIRGTFVPFAARAIAS